MTTPIKELEKPTEALEETTKPANMGEGIIEKGREFNPSAALEELNNYSSSPEGKRETRKFYEMKRKAYLEFRDKLY